MSYNHKHLSAYIVGKTVKEIRDAPKNYGYWRIVFTDKTFVDVDKDTIFDNNGMRFTG